VVLEAPGPEERLGEPEPPVCVRDLLRFPWGPKEAWGVPDRTRAQSPWEEPLGPDRKPDRKLPEPLSLVPWGNQGPIPGPN